MFSKSSINSSILNNDYSDIISHVRLLVLHAWIILLPKSLYLTTPTAFIWWMIKRGENNWHCVGETRNILHMRQRRPLSHDAAGQSESNPRHQTAGCWCLAVDICVAGGLSLVKLEQLLLIAVLITTVHLSEWHVELNGYTFHQDDIQKANGYQRGLSMTVRPHRDPANP